jgi:pimeloyl-ACP methyl ester carboxylesterase
VIPRLLHSVERGDGSLLRWFVEKRYPSAYPTHAFTVDAASGASPARRAQVAAEARTSLLGDAMNFFDMPEVAAAWGTRDLGEGFRAPVLCGVRTLFLSGTLDANTPPHQAERARWGFSDAIHLVAQNGGHEDWFRNARAQAATVAFLRGADVRGTDVDMPPLRFIPIEGPAGGVRHPALDG